MHLFPTQWLFAFHLSLAKCCLSHLFCFMSALSNLNLVFVVQQVLQIINCVLALPDPDSPCLTLETERLSFLSREKLLLQV